MTDQPIPESRDDLRQRYAETINAALRDGVLAPQSTTASSVTPDAYRAADAVLAVRDDEMERLRSVLHHYENTLTWNTTCHQCAAYLDSGYAETVRAEKAEAAAAEMLELIRDLADPDPCEHDHHGYCQTHDGGADCPDARARELLAAFDAETCAHRAGEPEE